MSLKNLAFYIFQEPIETSELSESGEGEIRRQKMQEITIWEGVKRALERGQFMDREKTQADIGATEGKDKRKMYENIKRVMVVAAGKKKGISNKRYLLTGKKYIHICSDAHSHTVSCHYFPNSFIHFIQLIFIGQINTVGDQPGIQKTQILTSTLQMASCM